jgi:signal peptidase I
VSARTAVDERAERVRPLPPVPRHRVRTCAAAAAVVVMLGLVVFAGYWAVTGGRWLIVRTPSMGMAAPVGTLLWVEPTTFSDIHVGDVISFHPPAETSTYSHRVHAINADGSLTTKGDANGSADPWKLTRTNIIGKVTMRWWAMGWLVRAAPILIIGGLGLWILIRRIRSRDWHLPVAIVGTALMLSLSVFILRPLVGAQRIALVPAEVGVSATYVSTGLLPLRLQAVGGGHVHLSTGQLGTVVNNHADTHGRYPITLRPDVPWWWWAVLVLACFLPAIGTTVFGPRSRRPPAHAAGLPSEP